MRRRELLVAALTVALAEASPLPIASITSSAEDVLTSSGTTAQQYEALVGDYALGYRGRPPAEFLADLTLASTDVIAHLRQPQATHPRKSLVASLGHLAGMAAVVLHDQGRQKEAHGWFRAAERAAVEVRDRRLRAWVFARQAMIPINYGRPEQAVALVERAQHLAGNAPTAPAALAAAVAARAYALAGQTELAARALRQADTLAHSLPDDERRDTWFGHSDPKHALHLSHAYTLLGATGHAREHQDFALAHGSSGTIARTLLTLDQARCQIHDGELDHGCDLATQALVLVPASLRGGLIDQRASDLYRQLPNTARAATAGTNFHAALVGETGRRT